MRITATGPGTRVRAAGTRVRAAARRIALLPLALGVPLGACKSSPEESEFPTGPIEIVSWATVGGPSDLLARALAAAAPDYFGGRRVSVLTRQGGAGAAGMQYVKSRVGDPHVLGVFTASGTVNMATGRIPFTPADFTPILRIQVDPFLFAVREDSPFRTLDDLFGAARARPGEVSVSGFGAASAHFLGFQRLRAAAGDPDVRWIAYEGSGDAAVAALGGHTDATHNNYNVIREHVRAGTMRVLAVALPLTALRDVPTYQEEGYDLAPVHWRGVVGPPGLSPEVQADLRDRLLATIRTAGFQEYMARAAMEYAVMDDSDAFGDWIREEVETNRSLLERLGLLMNE